MKKLTAEKCREQISNIRRWFEDDGFLSDASELNLQALEIALPILEQQERGEGEWIEWKGGLVPPVTGLVEVRYRNGKEQSGYKASEYSWALGLGGLTIIRYRIIPERATNQNGE